MTRPLGLRSVTNPLPTGLAADPESPEEVRTNASADGPHARPRGLAARRRGLRARVPGIAKAVARWLWDGRRRFVHLTVAGTGGQVLDARAVRDLRDALLAAGDTRLPLEVQAAEVVPVHVSLVVGVEPAYETRAVLDGVRGAVTTRSPSTSARSDSR
jgi:hypothetical protein